MNEVKGFTEEVRKSWHRQIQGQNSHLMWNKLMRLIPIIRKLHKPLMNINSQIELRRSQLNEVHNQLSHDKMNPNIIILEKFLSDDLQKLNDMEEQIMRQKTKIDWIWKGDGNNSYFHVALKRKHRQKMISRLYKDNGEICYTHEDIEKEILDFYKGLIGTADTNFEGCGYCSFEERQSVGVGPKDNVG